MTVRKAAAEDVSRVSEIYEKIHDAEEAGRLTTGWLRGIYPTAATAEAALARGDLFVIEENGVIIGSAIINRTQGKEYGEIRWKYDFPDEEITVMHTLAIDPDYAKKGAGNAFVAFYESYAASCGSKALRIDTQEKNTAARSLYKKCGFIESGVVPCVFNGIPDVSLVLLEKEL